MAEFTCPLNVLELKLFVFHQNLIKLADVVVLHVY